MVDDVQLVRKEEAESDDSQQTSTSSRSPLRLSDTSALALRMSRRLESSEQSTSQQSDADTAVAGASVDGECRDGTEELMGPLLSQGPGAVGTEASLGDGDEADEADEADSWLLEILDMQARMHGWFEIIRSAVLPPREAARLEELRAGCARAPPRSGFARSCQAEHYARHSYIGPSPVPALTGPPLCRGRSIDESALQGLGEPQAPLARHSGLTFGSSRAAAPLLS